MGRYTGIIIVSDVDGTFRSRIPENYAKNVYAVQAFKAGGGIFTFATGRDFYSLKSIVPDADDIVNAPVIVTNGAKLYDAKSGVYIIDARLNMPEFVKFIKAVTKKYPDTGVRFSSDGEIIVPEANDTIKNDLKSDGDRALWDKVKVIPIDEIPAMSKCVIVHNPEILADIQKMGEELDKGQNFYFSKSYERGLEAVNKDYTKGKTAMKLKKYLNIPNSILYAVGDYDNDIDMLLSADIGVCPRNAVDIVKASAKIITKTCDEGAIADLIEML